MAVSTGLGSSAPVSLSKWRPSTALRCAVAGAMTEPSIRLRSANECAGSWKAASRSQAGKTRPGAGWGPASGGAWDGAQAGSVDTARGGVGVPASGRSLVGSQAGSVDSAQAGRIIKLTLIPEEVRPDDGRQLGFWGNDAAVGTRAARALARVQGLLGPEAALTGVLQGGRDYTEQVLHVPWGEPRVPGRSGAPADSTGTGPTGSAPAGTSKAGPGPARHAPARHAPASHARLGRTKDEAPPWPGHLPGLAPAIVHHPPLPAQLIDESGDPVSVGSRGTASANPARLTIGSAKPVAISAWAGPWPLEERWWDAGGRGRAPFSGMHYRWWCLSLGPRGTTLVGGGHV